MFRRTVLLALLVLGCATLAMAAPAPSTTPEPAAPDLAWLAGGEPAKAPGACPQPELKAPVLVPIPRDCVSCRTCTSDTDCGGTSLGICATGPSYWTCGKPRACICR